jgi:hypothetical protein
MVYLIGDVVKKGALIHSTSLKCVSQLLEAPRVPEQSITGEGYPLSLMRGAIGIQPADLGRAVESTRGAASKQFRGRKKLIPSRQNGIPGEPLPSLLDQFPGGRDMVVLDQLPKSVDVALRSLIPRNFDRLSHAYPPPLSPLDVTPCAIKRQGG